MPVKTWERVALGLLAAIMLAIEGTLLWEKPDARYFAIFVVGAGLSARFFTKTYPFLAPKRRGASLVAWTVFLLAAAGVSVHFSGAITGLLHDNVAALKYGTTSSYAVYAFVGILLMVAGSSASYGIRYLMGRMPVAISPIPAPGSVPTISGPGAAPTGEIDLSKPKVLVATRGGPKLLEFAATYCRKTNAVLFVLFVRKVNVNITGSVTEMTLQEDPDAMRVFQSAEETCRKHGVQMLPIYAVSQDVPYTILDFAVTYGVEALLMGVSREAALLRVLRGDILGAVADNLPSEIPLLIHA